MFRTHAISGSAPNPSTMATRLVDTLLLWHGRARQRQHLASLDARMLRDIGLSRSDVAGETAKPFWRD